MLQPVTRRLAFIAAALFSVALFIVMIVVRKDTALVQALAGAGTLAAAVFAALAALAAQQAAAESSSTAARAREALARTIKPTMFANVMPGNGVGRSAATDLGPIAVPSMSR